jgi:hypothetical protein
MLLRLTLLSFFRDLSGLSPGIFRIVFSLFQLFLDVDLSSLFIVEKLSHRV